jgi:hypothetical protein
LGIAGVKHNREEIKDIQAAIGLNGNKITISDFGNESTTGAETWVTFSDEFIAKNTTGTIPVVTATSNQVGVNLSVIETTTKGFKVARADAASPSTFNWIAMAKVSTAAPKEEAIKAIPGNLLSQLEVGEAKKAPIKAYWAAEMEKGQAESARQAEAHKTVVAAGEKEVNATANYKADTAPLQRAEEAKKNYLVVPEDAPAKTLANPNPSKEGAPKKYEDKPSKENSLKQD